MDNRLTIENFSQYTQNCSIRILHFALAYLNGKLDPNDQTGCKQFALGAEIASLNEDTWKYFMSIVPLDEVVTWDDGQILESEVRSVLSVNVSLLIDDDRACLVFDRLLADADSLPDDFDVDNLLDNIQ